MLCSFPSSYTTKSSFFRSLMGSPGLCSTTTLSWTSRVYERMTSGSWGAAGEGDSFTVCDRATEGASTRASQSAGISIHTAINRVLAEVSRSQLLRTQLRVGKHDIHPVKSSTLLHVILSPFKSGVNREKFREQGPVWFLSPQISAPFLWCRRLPPARKRWPIGRFCCRAFLCIR